MADNEEIYELDHSANGQSPESKKKSKKKVQNLEDTSQKSPVFIGGKVYDIAGSRYDDEKLADLHEAGKLDKVLDILEAYVPEIRSLIKF